MGKLSKLRDAVDLASTRVAAAVGLGAATQSQDADAGIPSKFAASLSDYAKKMPYVHNTQPNPFDIAEKRFGMHKEPAGQYVTPLDSVPEKPPLNAYFQYGEKQWNNPLVVDFGSTSYESSKNWKKQLSKHYGGLTGKELTDAIRADGYDAVMTVDRYGNPQEAVDLYKGKGGVDMPTLDTAVPIALGALFAGQSQDADAAVEPSFKDKAMEGTGKALNFAFDAMELPSRGLHGLAAALGVLAEGGDWNAAIERGAEVSGQSIDETAQELGQYVADKTGSAPAAALTDAITRVATLEP